MKRYLIPCAVALIRGMTWAQQLEGSWDAARATIEIDRIDDVDYVRGELVVGLRSWEDFPKLVAQAQAIGDEVLGAIPRLAAVRVRIGAANSAAMADSLVDYRALSFVEYAERDAIGAVTSVTDAAAPDDPYYPIQWHLNNVGQTGGLPDADIDAVEGWSISTGSNDVVVAVIDTGLNLAQPEFAGRLVQGWDFLDEDDDPTGYGHGCGVTGLLGANANNGFEVAGVDHRCKIMPIKVGNGPIAWFDLAQGLDYAAAHHVDIISISLTGQGESEVLHDAVIEASVGAAIFAGAGNTSSFGTADKHIPAKYPEVISIGWTDAWDQRAFLSATGVTLDFVSSAVDVYTVSSTGSGVKTPCSGSSAATPIAAGIGAILKSLNPFLSGPQVYDHLRLGADDQVGPPTEDAPGWDPYFGHGRVNLRQSLEALCGCQGGESLIASPQTASVTVGDVVALRVDAGREHAGQPYWTVGGSSGAGTWQFGPLTLTLTPDDYSRFTLDQANAAILVNTHGLLDEAGQAMGFVMLPTGLAVGGPVVLNHVGVVFDGRAVPAHAVFATNVTTTVIEP